MTPIAGFFRAADGSARRAVVSRRRCYGHRLIGTLMLLVAWPATAANSGSRKLLAHKPVPHRTNELTRYPAGGRP